LEVGEFTAITSYTGWIYLLDLLRFSSLF